jgi:hypothetical protein
MTKRAWLWYDGNATFEITIKNVHKGSTAVRKNSRILIAPIMKQKSAKRTHRKLCTGAVLLMLLFLYPDLRLL